jgi:hypothetical protein
MTIPVNARFEGVFGNLMVVDSTATDGIRIVLVPREFFFAMRHDVTHSSCIMAA